MNPFSYYEVDSWLHRRNPTAKLAAHLAPRTRGYHEIWLDGELVHPGAPERNGAEDAEPIYGKVYLPRKFKTGLTVPEDNSVDIYAQDLGLLAVVVHYCYPPRKQDVAIAEQIPD